YVRREVFLCPRAFSSPGWVFRGVVAGYLRLYADLPHEAVLNLPAKWPPTEFIPSKSAKRKKRIYILLFRQSFDLSEFPAHIFGKFGSAFTSRICGVWRRVCPEISSTHWYPSRVPIAGTG